MQITAGRFKGKKLLYPKKNIRPTMDKVRSAIFNILNANFPELLNQASVCDIFCGAGSVGIEALSRGAQSAVFIDNNRLTLQYLRKNLINIPAQVRILAGDARVVLKQLEPKQFDFIFLDPPYYKNLITAVLNKIALYQLLKDNGVIVVEHHKQEKFIVPERLKLFKQKQYQQTVISILINKE
ncbi:MAG: 16S rRNA (guanine(966)-N(2))-methyltransferase RsmD [candidate division WOR-3 bacterium]